MTSSSGQKVQDPTRGALQQVHQVVDSLRHGAITCERNHRYYQEHREHHEQREKQPLQLLDFDVLSGVFRPLKLWETLQVVSRSSPQSSEAQHYARDVKWMMGPHSVRWTLSMASRGHFGLPLGTKYELLKRKQELTHTLSARGKKLVSRVDAAMGSDDPMTELQEFRRGEGEHWIIDELAELEPMYEELTVLSDLERQARPTEDLLDTSDLEATIPAYRVARSAMEDERGSEWERNIYCDALNVAEVVGLFRQARAAKAGLVPILISQTRAVLDLSSRQREFHLPLHDSLHVFTDYTYFLISQVLQARSNGKHRLIVTHARALEAQLRKLSDALDRVATHHQPGHNQDTPEWRMLHCAWARFQDDWSDLVKPGLDARRQDRISFRNALSRRKVREMLASTLEDKSTAEFSLRRLEECLDKEATRERGLLQLLTGTPENPPDLEASLLFDMRVLASPGACGYLLCESTGGVPLDEATLGDGPFRITVSQKRLSWILFAVDVWGDGRLSLAWCREASASNLWERAARLVSALAEVEADQQCEVACFYAGEARRRQTTLANAPQVLVEEVAANADYFEVAVGEHSSFCDLESFMGRESQMGIVTSAKQLASLPTREIARIMARTSAWPLEPKSCEVALGSIVTFLRSRL